MGLNGRFRETIDNESTLCNGHGISQSTTSIIGGPESLGLRPKIWPFIVAREFREFIADVEKTVRFKTEDHIPVVYLHGCMSVSAVLVN